MSSFADAEVGVGSKSLTKEEKRALGRERARKIAEARKEADLASGAMSSKTHNGHGSHNSSRSREFVKWLIRTFPLSKTPSNNLTASPSVLDVAAGNGEIALRLSFCEHIPTDMVDIREADLYNTLMKRIVAKLPKKWQEKLIGKSREDIERISSSVDCGSRLPTQIIEGWNSLEQVEGSDKLMRAVRMASVLVGMHADASTEPIVQLAKKYNKSYAVVPCCVFPNLFKERRIVDADGVSREVRSYEEFVEYLTVGGGERCTLNFDGRNECVYFKSREIFNVTDILREVEGVAVIDVRGELNDLELGGVYIYVHSERKNAEWVEEVKNGGRNAVTVVCVVDENETEHIADGVDYYLRCVKAEGESEWETLARVYEGEELYRKFGATVKVLGAGIRSLLWVSRNHEVTEEVQKWPVWESGAARFQESRWWEARPGVAEERCYIISGAANLIISEETNNANADAVTVRIEVGDRVVFRKGFTCEWEVGEEGISKHYEYFDASGEKFKNE
ncbi:hypothetical protein TrVE_jg283 [Triparma verrucosa]|uniref:(S)-ureidoglycine aminohydrolase cupin domain-containing protein n=1 Tax=Triparma verrucosa TaxID=1606542 RepID=A0A9W7F8X6_9STRA|nr:hypothetical protein TrVE_jg283 [Triparma verrucosa]